MPSSVPRADISTKWARCLRCPYRHAGTAPCPRAGYWLVSGEKVGGRASSVTPILYAPPKDRP